MDDYPEIHTTFFRLLSYYPLLIIGVGVVGNTISFIIFRFHSAFKSSSTMVYLSFVAITDTLSLFGWELDHYLNFNHYISIFTENKVLCKVSWFNQYASLQCSALLLSIMTVDRYAIVASFPGSTLSKFPFRTLKSAVIWSTSIVILIFIINLHLLIFSCTLLPAVTPNLTNLSRIDQIFFMQKYVNQYETGFRVYNTWEQVHSVIYVLVPLIIMTIANILIFKSLVRLKRASSAISNNSLTNSWWSKISNTLLAVVLNVLFISTTLPASICFAFEMTFNYSTLLILDGIAFTNHASLFLTCFATQRRFRMIVIAPIKRIATHAGLIFSKKSTTSKSIS